MPQVVKQDLKRWAVGKSEVSVAVLAVVYTDITNSTTLYNELGDETMGEVLDAHFTQCQALVEKHHGYLVKNVGDGFLAAFHAVINALDFAMALRTDTGHEFVAIHIGIDVGPLLIKHNDVYGGAANYAARLESVAEGREILVSDSAKSHLDAYRAQRHADLKWTERIFEPKGFCERVAFVC